MKKKIAFICIHNSCRSQMAEALGKLYLSDEYEIYSCGTIRKEKINQDAIRLMKEIYDIDMSNYYSKCIEDIPTPDIAISMGCGVTCPMINKGFDEDWGLEDPTGKDDVFFKQIISKIEENVKALKGKYS